MGPSSGRSSGGSRLTVCATTPPITRASPEPSWMPIVYTLSALPSRSLGKESVIMEKAQGLKLASPMPTPMRAAASVTKLRATLLREVITLQTITPAAIRLRRLKRSASAPIGRPNTVYTNAKAIPCSRPTWVSEMCRSCFSGPIRNARICRSAYDSV